MGGDYTRFTFDPRKGYNSVLRQQGRVAVDADRNEAAELGDRRWRSETYDLLSVEDGGPAGRCVVPRSTPDAFLVTPGGGSLTIGVGRAYVDGIQVECFGDPEGDEEWQAVLAELYGVDALPYDAQPFLPAPPPLPDVAYLAYLDVWYREIDHLSDPEIREIALGGPDHGTRVQTVWQVRALELGPGNELLECGDDLDAWDDLTAPSAGRLTTSTEAPQPGENPCILSPEGGYRGRENRLYRVEIHSVADDGAATWKWSRDNASVKAAVNEIAPLAVTLEDALNNPVAVNVHRLTVSSLGRDDVLRFVVGGWVEVLDEHVDLDPGRSGVLARVVEIDEAERWITLDRELPAADFDLNDPASRRTRVVRWDQTVAIADESASPQGSLDVQLGADAELEDGVHVEFGLDPAGGRFRVGDYWLFAARTADSSVEALDAAPPRGVHHHYARLAVVSPAGSKDCRLPWPPWGTGGEEECCCCDVVVAPGEDVQAAVDSVAEDGGTVCLREGEHRLPEMVVVAGNRVTIRGCGAHTRVLAPEAGGSAFEVLGDRVILESFALGGESEAPLVVATGDTLTVRELAMANRPGALLVASGVDGLDFVDNRCFVGSGVGVELSATGVCVARNRFSGLAGEMGGGGPGALHLGPGCAAVDVLDNRFVHCPADAVTLGGLMPGLNTGWMFLDVNGFDALPDAALAEAFAPVRDVRISRNRIERCGGSGIASLFVVRQVDDGAGAQPPFAGADNFTGLSPEWPVENVVVRTLPVPVENLTVSDNRIRGCVILGAQVGPRPDGAPYGGVVLGHVDRLRIVDNEITGNGAEQGGLAAGSPAVPVAGIFVQDVRELEVSGNLVVDNGQDGDDLPRHGGTEGGLVALDVGVELEWVSGLDAPRRPDGPAAALIHGNRVESVRGLALHLVGDGPMTVHDNAFSRLRRADDEAGGAALVVNTGLSPLIGGLARVAGLAGMLDAEEVSAFLATDAAQGSGPISFCGNQLRYDQGAVTDAAVVLLASADDVDFSHNRVDCRLPGDGLRLFADAVVLALTARSQGNGLSETLGAALLSLWNVGFFQSTGTGNQATHCVLVETLFGQRAEAHNLALCCAVPDLSLLPRLDEIEFPCRPPRQTGPFADTTDFTVGMTDTGGIF